MFEQPRAVRELAELPSVKSFLDFHTGADGIRQFDTTFRGDYLLDVLKREGFEPQKFANGGLVSLAPIARNMHRGPRALESLAPVARNMDRSMLRSG